MPLLLRDAALLWGEINLKNNDIAFEVITPAAQLKVNVYATKREEEAAAREFRNRTEFTWDAFVYFVDPDHKNDQTYIEAGRSYYHIHMFAMLLQGKGLRIDKLLPKSGHDKGDHRIDLVEYPPTEWDRLVATMSQRTRITVERFRTHYVEWYLLRQPD